MKKQGASTGPILVALILVIAGCYYSIENVDQVVRLVSGIKITNFSRAFAVAQDVPTGKNSAETNGTKVEKSSTSPKSGPAEESAAKKNWSEEEVRVFSNLQKRKNELDQREIELAKLDEELQKQKLELDEKLKELEKVRQGVASVLKERISVDSEKLDRLVDFYSNMKPQNAAKIFEEVDESLAVEILGRLKKKNAAEIMNLVKPDKAQRLSEKYTGYRR
ncbi:MAG: hypothetical protein SGJ18_10765 [Pseudomonadota bacterium]|nr:hypothetical protein [Pseudomonadota bacterium]